MLWPWPSLSKHRREGPLLDLQDTISVSLSKQVTSQEAEAGSTVSCCELFYPWHFPKGDCSQ